MSESPAVLLTYANLQMAAEALLNDASKTFFEQLRYGNGRSSEFTTSQAEQFVQEWAVDDHRENTSTGFSGTLFRCLVDDPSRGLVAGQQVMCFR